MKKKMFIYVINPEAYLQGSYSYSMTISDVDSITGWIRIGEVDIDVDDVDDEAMMQAALDRVDKKLAEIKVDREKEAKDLRTLRKNLVTGEFKND